MDDSESRLQAAGHGGRAELDVVVPGAQVEDGIHAILALASERTRGDGRILDRALNETAGRVRGKGNSITAAGTSGNEVVVRACGRCHPTASVDSQGCLTTARSIDELETVARSETSSIRQVLDIKRWAEAGRMRDDGNCGGRAGHDVDCRG